MKTTFEEKKKILHLCFPLHDQHHRDKNKLTYRSHEDLQNKLRCGQETAVQLLFLPTLPTPTRTPGGRDAGPGQKGR